MDENPDNTPEGRTRPAWPLRILAAAFATVLVAGAGGAALATAGSHHGAGRSDVPGRFGGVPGGGPHGGPPHGMVGLPGQLPPATTDSGRDT